MYTTGLLVKVRILAALEKKRASHEISVVALHRTAVRVTVLRI